MALQCVSCIYYSVQFQELDQDNEVQALINLDSKVNVITSIYTKKFGFTLWKISVGTQKIDCVILKTYSIALIVFLISNNLKRA